MGTIEGVTLRFLDVIDAVGGSVLRMVRATDPEFCGFGELYGSEILFGEIKAWKRHLRMSQCFVVPNGKVHFVLFDARSKSRTYGHLTEYVLGRPDDYALLRVPPLVWYGFMGISKQKSLVINCTDIIHDPQEIQRESISFSEIPYFWKRPSEADLYG